MVVFETRPEAIKVCPLVKELKRRDGFEVCVLVTGQHKEMLRQALDVFGIREDYNLDIMKEKQSLFDVTTTISDKIKSILEEERSDIVLVHGDTSTNFVVRPTVFYSRILVGHVEAGLRTYNKYSPYPERFNRQTTRSLTDFHFAPTATTGDNLLRKNKDGSKVFITGNTIIDALQTIVIGDYQNENLIGNKKMILLTMHRRENLGESVKDSFRAIKKVVNENEGIYMIYPAHLNPKVREIANGVSNNHPRIKPIEPLNVVDLHNFMKQSLFVMTDSGGIQEEAPALGRLVLVARDITERPEGVEARVLKLIRFCKEDVYNEITRLLTDKDEYDKVSEAADPYKDDHASERICGTLLKGL